MLQRTSAAWVRYIIVLAQRAQRAKGPSSSRKPHPPPQSAHFHVHTLRSVALATSVFIVIVLNHPKRGLYGEIRQTSEMGMTSLQGTKAVVPKCPDLGGSTVNGCKIGVLPWL